MELKPCRYRDVVSSCAVLIVPFMELKHVNKAVITCYDAVLIVPFMELKHQPERHPSKVGGS